MKNKGGFEEILESRQMAVGLAMVNFNGSDVLKMTLDSLLRARVKTPFVVCLIENDSEQKERRRQ